jgi:hypothetical protein
MSSYRGCSLARPYEIYLFQIRKKPFDVFETTLLTMDDYRREIKQHA